MVKVWKFMGVRTVKLQDASVDGRTLFIFSFKKIFNHSTNVLIAPFRGIFYDEYLADREDVRKLNSLLADLSGRKIEDFERMAMGMKDLMKKDKA